MGRSAKVCKRIKKRANSDSIHTSNASAKNSHRAMSADSLEPCFNETTVKAIKTKLRKQGKKSSRY
jgi:hypothetical protein